MECEIIGNLIRTIQDKRTDFIKQNGILPNMIVMDRTNQVLLAMHFMDTDMHTIYNMKILVDNSITRAEDIKLYYWSELERQDTQEKDFIYNEAKDVWKEFAKRMYKIIDEIDKSK